MAKIMHNDGRVLFEDAATTVAETLENAVAARVPLAGARITHELLIGADLRRANFNDVTFIACDFIVAHLDRAFFLNAYLDGCRFLNAALLDASFEGAVLERCVFAGNLRETNFVNVYAGDCEFDYSNMAFVRGFAARFEHCSFVGTHFDEAGLRRARLTCCKLWDAVFDGARLDGVYADRATLATAPRGFRRQVFKQTWATRLARLRCQVVEGLRWRMGRSPAHDLD